MIPSQGISEISSGDAQMFAQRNAHGMKTSTQFSTFVHLLQCGNNFSMAATQTYHLEGTRRAELLQVAHHLAFAYNEPDAAIS